MTYKFECVDNNLELGSILSHDNGDFKGSGIDFTVGKIYELEGVHSQYFKFSYTCLDDNGNKCRIYDYNFGKFKQIKDSL